MNSTRIWDLVRAERARLLVLFAGLDDEQWNTGSLCSRWSVRQVAGHLAAAGSTATVAWLANMVRAGFSTDRHNARLLEKYLGAAPAQTLENFQQSCRKSIAPLNSAPGLLGEVVVHGQDIAVPLGLGVQPAAAAVREVAEFFVAKDFAVNSSARAKGLSMVAMDDGFRSGQGPVVRGELLDLVMAMAGRTHYLPKLQGPGVSELADRLGRGL